MSVARQRRRNRDAPYGTQILRTFPRTFCPQKQRRAGRKSYFLRDSSLPCAVPPFIQTTADDADEALRSIVSTRRELHPRLPRPLCSVATTSRPSGRKYSRCHVHLLRYALLLLGRDHLVVLATMYHVGCHAMVSPMM